MEVRLIKLRVLKVWIRLSYIIVALSVILLNTNISANAFQIAILKYKGGDWYSANSGVANFLKELSKRTPIKTSTEPKIVELKNSELFQYPFLFLNGHHAEEGIFSSSDEKENVKFHEGVADAKKFTKRTILFDKIEKNILRQYLENGGFLFVNDDYGLYYSFFALMEEVFPDNKPVRLYENDKILKDILTSYYKLKSIPKIHKHDGEPVEAYGLVIEGRLSVLYLYSADIADGWEPKGVFSDPIEIRNKAIKFGINLVFYVLTH